MDSKSTNAEGTWFIVTSQIGKLICFTIETIGGVKSKHIEGSVVLCAEAFELMDPVSVQEGHVPGSMAVSRQAIATPLGLVSSQTPAHVSLRGAIIVYFAEMSDVDQAFHQRLLVGPRQLMAGWLQQRDGDAKAVKLASAADLMSLGHPRRS